MNFQLDESFNNSCLKSEINLLSSEPPQDQSPNPQSYEKSTNPLSNEAPQNRNRSSNHQSDGKFSDSRLKPNIDPLDNSEQTSELKFASARAQFSDIQSDEKSRDSLAESETNPLSNKPSPDFNQSLGPRADGKSNNPSSKSEENPLKNCEQTSLSSFIFNLFFKIRCNVSSQSFTGFQEFFRHPPGMNHFKPP